MRPTALRLLAACTAAACIPACLDAPRAASEELPAPGLLTAVALPEGARIQLTWIDRSDGETAFRVDVADSPIAADADVDEWTLVPADATSYVYDAPPDVTRWFRVLAVTALHQSAPSNVASATTPDVPPAPGRLDALVGPDDSDLNVTVAWDDAGNADGYQVERSLDGLGWTPLAALGAGATVCTDVGTAYDGRYQYRVRGVNANGAGPWAVSPWARTRSTAWTRIASDAGDLSWNVSLVILIPGIAYLSCYDAWNGGIVLGTAFRGNGSVGTSSLPLPWPNALGHAGTSMVHYNGFHIAASDGVTESLYHLTDEREFWEAYRIDGARAGDRAVIRSGPDASLHVVYQHARDGLTGLRYGFRIIDGWVTEWVFTGEPADAFAFDVDLRGGLHVVYAGDVGGGRRGLLYARKPPEGSWSSAPLPTQADPEMLSLALDSAGQAHVAYNSTSSGALHLVTNAGGGWREELVHRTPRGSWGRYNSIALDPVSGAVHVAYVDNLHGALYHARRPTGGAWDLQLVDGVGDVGRFASLRIDAEGRAYIAYGDATNADVKVATSLAR